MVSAAFPDENEPLLETHRRGVPSLDMSKLSIWAPDAITALRPDPGGHVARPVGAILPPRDEVLLLHYKHLGARYLIDRHRALATRVGPDDLAAGWGHQWMASDDALRATLAHYDESAIDVLAAGEADYPTPLWWRGKYPRVQNSGRLLELEAEIGRCIVAQAALAEEHGLMKRDLEAIRLESAARAGHLAAAETGLRAAEHEKALLKNALETAAKRIADLEHSRTWRWTSGLRRIAGAAVHAPGTVNTDETAAGEPDTCRASPLALLKDLATYGAIGRYIWHSRQITGWTRGAEAAAVAEASLRLADAPVIVEVGCFLGCATTLLAGPRRIRRSGIVHCIDPFDCSGDSFSVPVYRSIADELRTSLRAALMRTSDGPESAITSSCIRRPAPSRPRTGPAASTFSIWTATSRRTVVERLISRGQSGCVPGARSSSAAHRLANLGTTARCMSLKSSFVRPSTATFDKSMGSPSLKRADSIAATRLQAPVIHQADAVCAR